jgi:hypothetical protein
MKVMDQLKQLWQSDDEAKTITYIVKKLNVSDVEDPDIIVGQYIWEWQESEAGKWVMENSRPLPSWHRSINHMTYGYQYDIRAYLTPKQITYFELKYK